MPSTVIRTFHYDPEPRELMVEFTTGRRYIYRGVPLAIVAAFQAAFSKGRYFNAHIRDHYPFSECVESS
jgi:hypothetical protein